MHTVQQIVTNGYIHPCNHYPSQAAEYFHSHRMLSCAPCKLYPTTRQATGSSNFYIYRLLLPALDFVNGTI